MPRAVRLRRDALHIWRVSLRLPDALIGRCEEMLSPEERERARRFVDRHNRHRYIVSRAALRLLLARYCGGAPEGVRFALGPHDKPRLVEAGEGDIRFNLSHAGELALIGIAAGRELGVDLEPIRIIADFALMARRFFSEPEAAALAAAPEPEAAAAFLRCWTRKEAFVKALGAGLTLDLKSFYADMSGAAPAIRWIEGAKGTDRPWSIADLEPAPGYVGAVAIDGAMPTVERLALEPHWPADLALQEH
jgi:4'-phosphopantetheinyl transferase